MLSQQLQERAESCMPGGVNSNARMWRTATFFSRAKGAWIWDVTGTDYVDYVIGQGPSFLGHAPPAVLEAVSEASEGGVIYGGQHPLEVAAAEAVCGALEWADMVRFGLTGTEMVQAALRLARAATGRRKFVRFEGAYHGWLDNMLMPINGGPPGPASAGQVADYLEDSLVLPWNDPDALIRTIEDQSAHIAAIIAEPVLCDCAVIVPKPGFLELLRQVCDSHGIVLVFDEVITGFRLAFGGAAEHFGVEPDLAIYGKAIASGWPVAAVAGRGELMERFAVDVAHGGTGNGSVLGSAAVVSTLAELERSPPYDRVSEHGAALMNGMAAIAESASVPLKVQGLPSVFFTYFGSEQDLSSYRELASIERDRYRAFAHRLVDAGLWVNDRGVWFVSAAHGSDELAAALDRFARALSPSP